MSFAHPREPRTPPPQSGIRLRLPFCLGADAGHDRLPASPSCRWAPPFAAVASSRKPSGAAINTPAPFASTITSSATTRKRSTTSKRLAPDLHFLRQAYKNPTNPGDGSWRFIYVNAAGQIIGSTKYANLQQMALMDANGGQLPTTARSARPTGPARRPVSSSPTPAAAFAAAAKHHARRQR